VPLDGVISIINNILNLKIMKVLKKVRELVEKNSDKLNHFLVCILIMLLFIKFDLVVFHREVSEAMGLAVFFTLGVAIAKEVADFFTYRKFSGGDLIAGVIGIAIGMALTPYFFIWGV
jgi:hypothetical protein